MDDIGGVDPVQDHVHDPDHIGQRLLFLPVKRPRLEDVEVPGGQSGLGQEVIEGFTQKAARSAGTIDDPLPDLGIHHPDHRPDQRSWGVVLAPIPPRIAHVPNLGLVQMGQFMLFLLRPELEGINPVDDLPQVVPAGNFVLNLAEYLPDLVFQRIGSAGPLLEPLEVGEQLPINELEEVITGQGGIVVDLPILPLGSSPDVPAVLPIQKVGVSLPLQFRFRGAVLLRSVEIFQEEKPGRLFNVVEFSRTPGLFPEDVVDILKACSNMV